MLRVTAASFFFVVSLVYSTAAAAQDTRAAAFSAEIQDAASLQQTIDARLARARQALDAVLAVKGRRTIANTLAPFDRMWGELYTAEGEADVVARLHPDAAMRTLGEELGRRATAGIDGISLRSDLYHALEALEMAGADAPARAYVGKELRSFRLAGVDKPEAVQRRVKELREQLTRAMDEFQRNIRERRGRVAVKDAAELGGLPEDFIAAHKPDANGEIVLTTDIVDARPVMTYANSGDLRRRMMLATQNVAYPENTAVLARMLQARAEIARQLGYSSWAAYDMASRMVGTVETVSQFIDRVVGAAAARADREYQELVDLKRRELPGEPFHPWDRLYYSERARRASYDFDSRRVRPYFSFDHVLRGTLALTARIFGLEYRVAAVPVWHPSVQVYDVLDGGRLIGRVYLDLHRRPHKSATSASVSMIRYGSSDGAIPEVVLSASLPGGQDGDPGLMTHDDVRTLFHEFGHVVHRISGGNQRWQRSSSITMERDFGEAPSQMLEEWAWDAHVLAGFAKHYQTGEAIPAPLVTQMRRASEFGQGLDVRAQMVLARVSLLFHDRDPSGLDTTTLWAEIQKRDSPVGYLEGMHREASFPHLGNPGYASAYYTYMWSLVMAKDLFSAFDGIDLAAPRAAWRFRQAVFAPGSTKPAADVVRDFLGRPYSFDAWARWMSR